MSQAKDPITNEPYYSSAVAISLMIFYAFAMQCMSTIAVVYRESKSWKIPLLQFIYMGALAYVSSYVVYHLLK
jgi:ferrous iron transport protein B